MLPLAMSFLKSRPGVVFAAGLVLGAGAVATFRVPVPRVPVVTVTSRVVVQPPPAPGWSPCVDNAPFMPEVWP